MPVRRNAKRYSPNTLSGAYPTAEKKNVKYVSSRGGALFMKSPPGRPSLTKPSGLGAVVMASHRQDSSLFALLLELESGLRKKVRGGAHATTGKSKMPIIKHLNQPLHRGLPRYIE
jgi:hypothetical protein